MRQKQQRQRQRWHACSMQRRPGRPPPPASGSSMLPHHAWVAGMGRQLAHALDRQLADSLLTAVQVSIGHTKQQQSDSQPPCAIAAAVRLPRHKPSTNKPTTAAAGAVGSTLHLHPTVGCAPHPCTPTPPPTPTALPQGQFTAHLCRDCCSSAGHSSPTAGPALRSAEVAPSSTTVAARAGSGERRAMRAAVGSRVAARREEGHSTRTL